mmetsp:Transcript_21535/g.49705  ORF Transcript_21535/g.49705 Transcript_21535/m.49705 type:complete len:237 (-) Transcript_21535:438-1148(-)
MYLVLVATSFGQGKQQFLQQINALTGHARCFNHGGQGMQFAHTGGHIFLLADREWPLANVRRSQQLYHLLLGRCKGMLGTSIHFRKDHHNGNTKTTTQVQMMLRHVRWGMSAVDQDQGIIGHTGGNTMNRRFEILFMSCQIHQGDNTIGFTSDFVFGFALIGPDLITSCNGFSRRTKSHQMRCGRRRPTGFNLVAMFHNGRAAPPTSIVQTRRCERPDQCRFARIDISHHGHTNVA